MKRYALGVCTATFLGNCLIKYIPDCYVTDKLDLEKVYSNVA